MVVIAGVGDQPAVRRHRRALVGPGAVGQRPLRPAGHVQLPHVVLLRVALPVVVVVGGEQDRLAVRRPAQRTVVIEPAKGQLTRLAAVGADQEDVAETGAQIAFAVGAVGDLGDQLQRVGPGGALGLGRRRAQLFRVAGDKHRQRQRLAVRRPGDRPGRLLQRRHPGRLAAVQPQHIELRRAAWTGRHKGQPPAVRRPARGDVGAVVGHQWRLGAAGQVDQPDRGARAVQHDVAGVAHIGRRAAVWPHLRVGGEVQREQVARLQRLGRLRHRRTRRQTRQRRQHPNPHDQSPEPSAPGA